MDEKKIKSEFRAKAQKNPEKYYPVDFLKERGYVRKRCSSCRNYFWTLDYEREICGDPNCIGGYAFIGERNTKVKLDFIDSWKLFEKIFKKLGYEPIKRYPVLARWRDDLEFVIASIADFQPYVVNGLVEPPANPLVVPQFCLRFTDIDNVGYTGRHYTGFVMIGQHAFVPPQEYDKEKYLSDIHYWLTQGMGIEEKEIIYHEDAWAGGGNLGPSMEFFAKGLEIGNQVYMQYDISGGDIKTLDINVLDMGMGQERVAWFSHGTATSYEANFPSVMKHLYKSTGVKVDEDIIMKFLPYSALLNVDEVVNIDKVWEDIAKSLSMDVKVLRESIEPLAALYGIAEHTRTLLVAISDGALPSNVGGGYNLRVIARRSFDFMEHFSFNIDLNKIFEIHANYLEPQYPELKEHLEDVKKIMSVERRKYEKSREYARKVLSRYKGKKISVEEMISLYDTHGISPEMMKEAGVVEKIPDNFFALVAQHHESHEKQHRAQTKRELSIDLSGVEETEILYWGDWKITEFEGKVVKVIPPYVLLNRTAFYPTSGGQMHDTGWMIDEKGNKYRVKDVIKYRNYVVHVLENTEGLKVGMRVKGIIDFERRKQHAQHHTATHILNDACRKVLGNHVWQAGAEKTMEKARLDITHYDLPSYEEIKKIEMLANDIIQQGIEVKKMVLERNIAEQKFGFRIYQGGAPPGKYIRIVQVGDDVEACGGTHLNNSLEAALIKIINVKKLQDGMIRFEFVAGKRAIEYVQEMDALLKQTSEVFNVPYKDLPKTAQKFFEEWKSQRKEIERLRELEIKILIEDIDRGVKNVGGKRIAEITSQVEMKDLMKALSMSRVDAVLVKSKRTMIVSKNNDAHNIAEMLGFDKSKIKGKGKVVVIMDGD